MKETDSPRVLIVDDEEGVRKVLTRWLANGEYECRQAASGQEMIAILNDEEFCLVILDIMLPDASGVDLLRELQEKHVDLAVIMATGLDDRGTAFDCLKSGAFGYMIKPFQHNEVMINVANALHRRNLEIQNRLYKESLENLVLERTKALSQANKDLVLEVAERKESEARFRSIFEHAGAGMCTFTPEGAFIQTNPSFSNFVGYSAEHLQKKSILDIIHPEDAESLLDLLKDAGNGKLRPPDTDRKGDLNYAISLVQDITGRKKAEQALQSNEKRLQYLSHHDPLTQLPNRALFYEYLQRVMVESRRRKKMAAVIFMDLDHFKKVNDTLGHETGDLLLRAVSKKLLKTIRESDMVARLGGDEFVAILENLSDAETVRMIAERILRAMSRSFRIMGHELFISTSLGISLFPANGEDVQSLLRAADLANYQAKASGRENYKFYSPDMDLRFESKYFLERDLRQALGQKQFQLHYQPQMDIQAGRMAGAEALLRWEHPKLGMVSPAEFIPLAEESGLITAIGEWVLQTACAQSVRWLKDGFPPITIAVNISPRQFLEHDFIEKVERIIQKTGIDPNLLELEITEGMIMENLESAIILMEKLTGIGVKIAIDDFGTGYSSLRYLKNFPVSKLKIDRSFICDIIHSPGDVAIVSSIISLAENMDIKVVAEGVENQEQVNLLRDKECFLIQGFFFSQPLSVEDFSKLQKQKSPLGCSSGMGKSFTE
jgi:diguanylate cyclase (GGDEF)-like protein